MNWEILKYNMEQSIIDNLPNILKNSIDTLENISYDNINDEYMANSQKTAIDFDKVKDDYSTQNVINKPKSNDALYIAKNNIHYFIEFKNGNYRNLKKSDLMSKTCDSVYILYDIKYPNGNKYIEKYIKCNQCVIDMVNFSKNYIVYILVYNSANNQKRQNYNLRFYIKSNFGLNELERILLKKVYIYDEKEFETKFINGTIANEP